MALGQGVAERRFGFPAVAFVAEAADTQSAVRSCFTLIIARSPGWQAFVSSFATTPSVALARIAQPSFCRRQIGRGRRGAANP